MEKLKHILAIVTVITLSAFTINNVINWQVSDNYKVKFSGTDAEGIFKNLKGNIKFDESDLVNSKCNFTIDVSSINTGNGTKNKHAVSSNWFDADTYPEIKFTSDGFMKMVNGYSVSGSMEIHGVKKTMTIPFTFNNKMFKSKFSVNRLDFGVGAMKGMSKKVSNEIKLDISIPVSKI